MPVSLREFFGLDEADPKRSSSSRPHEEEEDDEPKYAGHKFSDLLKKPGDKGAAPPPAKKKAPEKEKGHDPSRRSFLKGLGTGAAAAGAAAVGSKLLGKKSPSLSGGKVSVTLDAVWDEGAESDAKAMGIEASETGPGPNGWPEIKFTGPKDKLLKYLEKQYGVSRHEAEELIAQSN